MVKKTEKEKIVALIQVRMGSSRLPGKAMHLLCGRPLLGHLIDRISAACSVDETVVVTSDKDADDRIESFCRKENILYLRGSEDDVCARMNEAVKRFPAGHYLRFCGDAPMQDPEIIDAVVALHLREKADYTTNGVGDTRTFPLGLDVRIAGKKLWQDSFLRRDQALKKMENPLAYVHAHLENYRCSLYRAQGDCLRPELRFIADYPQDLKILEEVFEILYKQNKYFRCADAVACVDSRPCLKGLMNEVKDLLKIRKSETSVDTSYRLRC